MENLLHADHHRICFISSPGGHFTEALDIAFKLGISKPNFVVSGRLDPGEIEINLFNAPESNRDFRVLGQFKFALFFLLKYRPTIIISTGAGIAVPFFLFKYFIGAKGIFIESPTAIYRPTLTLSIVKYLADRIYVRSMFLHKIIKNSIYLDD